MRQGKNTSIELPPQSTSELTTAFIPQIVVERTLVVRVRRTTRDMQGRWRNVTPRGGAPKVSMIIRDTIVPGRFQLLELVEGNVVHAVHRARFDGGFDVGTVALEKGPRAATVVDHLERSRSRGCALFELTKRLQRGSANATVEKMCGANNSKYCVGWYAPACTRCKTVRQ